MEIVFFFFSFKEVSSPCEGKMSTGLSGNFASYKASETIYVIILKKMFVLSHYFGELDEKSISTKIQVEESTTLVTL